MKSINVILKKFGEGKIGKGKNKENAALAFG